MTKNLNIFIKKVKILPKSRYCQIYIVENKSKKYIKPIMLNKFFFAKILDAIQT